ncbi:glycosyltransferase family 4 protein [Shewanella salipaludis]|uniref:Glycosyltransferase family 4 protein n=1 Tax=Shewanella salipaludis TaxID=2723052 RepID=A0A972FV53_9GAMM|nr:glycosyltransferase family 4 protein [Shewanella salipaludis]NMH66693.1 glycosyltransferase family 4 protein [Shewanella salipaludis]
MKILHVLLSKLSLPPLNYGGTERVVWALAKAQEAQGHQVRFLWGAADNLPANAAVFDKSVPIEQQIGDWPDLVHFHRPYQGDLAIPYICTEHGNAEGQREYGQNTVFLSRRHAENHNATCFVHNGLDWADYGEPELTHPGDYFHFLGKAKWPIKNLVGAVAVARLADVKMKVIGGHRLNFSRKFYFYPDTKLDFVGMVGGEKKNALIRRSRGLIFPVRWHEPFGLALIESLYLGTPVFGSPYGALPEIVTSSELGKLSLDYRELADAVANVGRYDRAHCHEYARENFNHFRMAGGYQACYERVLDGESLNATAPFSTQSWHDLLPVND